MPRGACGQVRKRMSVDLETELDLQAAAWDRNALLLVALPVLVRGARTVSLERARPDGPARLRHRQAPRGAARCSPDRRRGDALGGIRRRRAGTALRRRHAREHRPRRRAASHPAPGAVPGRGAPHARRRRARPARGALLLDRLVCGLPALAPRAHRPRRRSAGREPTLLDGLLDSNQALPTLLFFTRADLFERRWPETGRS